MYKQCTYLALSHAIFHFFGRLHLQVPKGPQLKIQNACRKAGLVSQGDETVRAPAAFYGPSSGNGSAAGVAGSCSDGVYDPSECKICFDKEIEVSKEHYGCATTKTFGVHPVLQ